ncbi:hypothetical protein GCM10020220_020600 [Nonomuraea rubra]
MTTVSAAGLKITPTASGVPRPLRRPARDPGGERVRDLPNTPDKLLEGAGPRIRWRLRVAAG